MKQIRNQIKNVKVDSDLVPNFLIFGNIWVPKLVLVEGQDSRSFVDLGGLSVPSSSRTEKCPAPLVD